MDGARYNLNLTLEVDVKKFLFFVLAGGFVMMSKLNGADLLDVSNQPTIGNPNSKVQVVAFLEPKCPDSKTFNNGSYSTLKSEYIDTNKISYSVVTTSFLYRSMPAAISLLCVYKPDSTHPQTSQFFSYLDYIYKHQPPEREDWATIETLQSFISKAIPSIDKMQIRSCIENNEYKDQIEKNSQYGTQLMGRLSTPTIFVNGVKVENKDDTIYYPNLKKVIENALEQEGK